MLRGQPVHGQGDEPVHVPQHEEGEERDEDRQQKEVPHVLEEIARLAEAAVEDESLDPGPALGQQAPKRRRRLGQVANHGVEAEVDLPRHRRKAVHQCRALSEHTRPEQEAGNHQHGDDDGEQRAHRHASPDGQGVRPRDRRTQEIRECGREEHGQEQAAGQPGEGREAAPREEPARLHSGPAVSGPGSVASTGLRRAYMASIRERLRITTTAIRALPSMSASKSLL